MDDCQAIKSLSDEFERICLQSLKKASPVCKFGFEENATSPNENNDSSGVREFSPDQGHILPILKEKVMYLSTTVRDLKREHANLSVEMNGLNAITTNILAQPEMITIVEHMGTEVESIRMKYLKELSERKRLYNEVLELKGNIRVFCRCRPLNRAESEDGLASVVEFDPSQENELQINCSDSSKKQFKFDHVFKPEDDQEAVFSQTKPVVTSVLDGYNVCIFAYGQTGTGKTFTMEGTPENRGVNYRTLEELFRISEDRSGIMRYELFVSMLEVYNEKIKDLLVEKSEQASKKLEIKQSAEGTQEVPGLIEARVFSTDEVWELLKSGSRARSVGSTSANELSSRSHCLLRVTVKGENLMDGQKMKSHLWLVDLAGSERVGKIDVEGERLKESQFINKSLSALGDVIFSLASKSAHIPYRNSKLTHMLQNSLGGDCKTLMFVQISPSAADTGETLCSLNFASRTRGIENGPARKQSDVTELFKYKQMVEKMKHDEKEAKKALLDNLQSVQLRLQVSTDVYKKKVRDLEMQLAEERKMRMKQEESRALTKTMSSSSSAHYSAALPPLRRQAPLKTVQERRPPRGSSKPPRLPLRIISNVVPASSSSSPSNSRSSIPSFRGGPASSASAAPDKENQFRADAAAAKSFLRQPRRITIAMKPPQPSSAAAAAAAKSFRFQARRISIVPTATNKQLPLPRRRVSIATFSRPEPSLHDAATTTTPLCNQRNGNGSRHSSYVRDSTKGGRCSQLFSPRPDTTASASDIIRTPAAATRRISTTRFMVSPISQQVVGSRWKPRRIISANKFMGSPPISQQVVGSWKPRHPTVVALQHKSLVWSPLKIRRGLKKNATRSSSMAPLPSRSEM